MLKQNTPVIEYIPLREYYHRHTRSIFWELQVRYINLLEKPDRSLDTLNLLDLTEQEKRGVLEILYFIFGRIFYGLSLQLNEYLLFI